MEGFHQVYSQANGTALAQKDNQHSNYTLLHELKDFDPSPKAKLPPPLPQKKGKPFVHHYSTNLQPLKIASYYPCKCYI